MDGRSLRFSGSLPRLQEPIRNRPLFRPGRCISPAFGERAVGTCHQRSDVRWSPGNHDNGGWCACGPRDRGCNGLFLSARGSRAANATSAAHSGRRRSQGETLAWVRAADENVELPTGGGWNQGRLGFSLLVVVKSELLSIRMLWTALVTMMLLLSCVTDR